MRLSVSCMVKKHQDLKVLESAVKGWRPTIGLEIHAQLQTRTKMFSMASFNDNAGPNSSVSQFDMAAPGTLPVLNRVAVMLGIRTGLLLNCQIPPKNRFERKHYFYADMPAGYQITQQNHPIAHSGYFDFYVHSDQKDFKVYHKRLNVARIQLEIDSGKTLYDLNSNRSLIDLNRAGVGLIEIVSEPGLASAIESYCFAEQLLMLLSHNAICGGQMHKGQFRVDANVSLAPEDSSTLGVRTEIKNMNSLRMVYLAVNYEIVRQYQILSHGGTIVNETRAVDDQGRTVPMRDKEVETDYRFLPEPNLPVVVIKPQWLVDSQKLISRKPDYLLFIEDYGLSTHDAFTIAKSTDLSLFVKQLLHICKAPVNDILVWLHELRFICSKCNIRYPPKRPGFQSCFATAIRLCSSRQISKYTTIALLREVLKSDNYMDIEQVIEKRGLWRVTDESEIEGLLEAVFKKHNAIVKRALKTPTQKLMIKLRNELIQSSGKRIDLVDADDFVASMLEKLRKEEF